MNLDVRLISQPDNGEQALEIADTLIRSGSVDALIIDSVAVLTAKGEVEGEMDHSKERRRPRESHLLPFMRLSQDVYYRMMTSLPMSQLLSVR